MKSKTTTLLVLVAVILCLFSCGQPDSPAAGSDPTKTPPEGGKQPSALDSVVWQDTPYLLWDWDESNGFAYTISENGKTGTKFADTYWQFSNFCFDDDDTLWYISSSGLYKKVAGYDSVKIENESLSIKDIDYDVASSRFYCIYEENDSFKVKIIEKENLKTASKINDVEGEIYTLECDEKFDMITAAAVDGNTYYVIYHYETFMESSSELKAYTLTSGSASIAAKASMSLTDNEALFGTYDNTTKQDVRKFSDIKAYAGNVYILGSQCVFGEYPEYTLISRGAVFMMTTDESVFTLKDTVGLTPVTDIEKKFKDDDSENTFTITLTSNIPEKASSSSILLSPQKFIAIKPKKLIIADRGVVWVSDTAGNSDVERQSRIATIDLESFTVTSEPYDGIFVAFSDLSSGYSAEIRGAGCSKGLRVFDYD